MVILLALAPYTNVGGVLNLLTKPISRDFEQSIRERITIAEDTGNAYYDIYYRASGLVTEDLGLQLQMTLHDGEGFRDHSETDVQNIILDAKYYNEARVKSALEMAEIVN